MTDLIERAGKALEDYEKNKKEWRHGFAKELFATPALTLLPEAIEEIKRLQELLADIQSSQSYTYYGRDWKPVLARDLEDRAEAAEAKLAVALAPEENMMTDEKYDLPEKVWVCRGNFGLHCQLDKPTGEPEGAFYVPQAQVAAAYQRAAELIENYDGEILECELHYAAAEIRAMMEEK